MITTEKSTVKTESIFSEDREYRYILKKEWDSKKPKVSIIMTNPSISDMVKIDYTTMFIINNLVRLDYGGFDILNLIPKVSIKLKSTESEDIPDDIFDENIKHIVKSAVTAEKVLIAWGSLNTKTSTGIKNEVLEALKPYEEKLFTISNEYGGKAYHPLAPAIRSIWLFNEFSSNVKTADDKAESQDEEADNADEENINTDEQPTEEETA